jgi:hypothetical protein
MLGSTLYSLKKIYFYAKQHQELEWAINYIKMTQIALYAYILINTFYDAAYFDLYYQLIALSIIIKQIVFKFYINERISKSIPKTVSEKVNLGSGMHLIRDVTSQ